MTDHARLRALCDAVEMWGEREIAALHAACDPATIRALLDAADERDALRDAGDNRAAICDRLRAERDALSAAAEQARAQLRELSYDFDIDREALVALDKALKGKS